MEDPRGVSPRAQTFIVATSVVVGIATVTVILRFMARLWRPNPAGLGADDWLIIPSLLLAYGFVIEAVLFAHRAGLGWPTATLSPLQLTEFFKIFFADQIIYSLICPTVKISILITYRRIFKSRNFNIAIWIVGGIVMAWGIAVLFTAIFQCTPVEGYWNPLIAEHCIEAQTFFWGNSISNLLTDVIILALPIPMVWQLNLSWQRKIAICCVFLLGSFVCVASILRIVSLGVIEDVDVSYTLPIPALWSSVEPAVGIISACLPTLPPLIKRIFVRSKSTYASNKMRSYSSRLSDPEDQSEEPKSRNSSANNAARPQVEELELEWTGSKHTAEIVNARAGDKGPDGVESDDQAIVMTREVSIFKE